MTVRILLPAALAAATALALATSSSAQPTARAAACTKGAVDVESIIDDSGSMAGTDPSNLRVQGMQLFIDQGLATDRLGAVKFGDATGNRLEDDTGD